ncbi:MAG: hypothetical protein KGR98_10835, partial [Verrucomicrobia bacterium]|nr:hypothetical protein [Verrucomicrobiota bacterium]
TRPEIIRRFAEQIPFLDALFPDYGKRVSTYAEATYPTARNVPVFHATTSWPEKVSRQERVQQLVEDIHAITPARRPAFLHPFALNWFTDLPLLQEVMDRLGPDYVAVRPDQLAALFREHLKKVRVWSRFASPIAVIEHEPIQIPGQLRNVSAVEQNVRIRLVAGLDQAAVEPEEVKLVPAEETVLRLRGAPTGGPIQIELNGAFGKRLVTIAVHPLARAELARPLPSGGILSPVEYFEAENLAHRSGEAGPDPSASGGAAWFARRGKAEPGFILYGPYAPLEKGKYLSLFRLKRLDAGAGQVALLDTCVGGGVPQTGQLEVRVRELPLNQWRWFPIVFRHPGRQVETRVQWSGSASLEVDAVALWKIRDDAPEPMETAPPASQ